MIFQVLTFSDFNIGLCCKNCCRNIFEHVDECSVIQVEDNAGLKKIHLEFS